MGEEEEKEKRVGTTDADALSLPLLLNVCLEMNTCLRCAFVPELSFV